MDPAANPAHADLTQDELLTLAAADVQDLSPGEDGGVGPTWLGLAATALLLMVSGLLIRWRSRRQPDGDEEPGHNDDGSPKAPPPNDPPPNDFPPSDDHDPDAGGSALASAGEPSPAPLMEAHE